jgi:hypothetical protein
MSQTSRKKNAGNGRDDAAEPIVQCYVAGRKPFKSPDGETYPIGEYVPDAHLFPNLALLLDRHRLLPAQMSPAAIRAAKERVRKRQEARERKKEEARREEYARQREDALREAAEAEERLKAAGGQLPPDEEGAGA